MRMVVVGAGAGAGAIENRRAERAYERRHLNT